MLQGIGSLEEDEDKEELEGMETVQTSAARIERTRKTDNWKNPTKIIKKPEPMKEKERKLAVPKAIRSSNWKPAMVEDDIELDDNNDQKTEDAVLVQVEDNPEKKQKPRTLKKKYLDVIKESTDPEAVFDKVMKQPVTIKLQDLLTCSPTFARLLFKGIASPKEEISIPLAKVDSIGLCQRHWNPEKTYAAKILKLLVKVNRTTT